MAAKAGSPLQLALAQISALLNELDQPFAVVGGLAVSARAELRVHPPRAETIVIDLLFASSGIEREIVEEAEQLVLFAGVRVPVATRAALVALKVLARGKRRPQDDVDLAGLVPALDEGERRDVERLRGLISARGYARGKKLVPDFRRIAARLNP